MRRRHIQIKQQRTRPRPTPRTSPAATGLAYPPHLVTRVGCKTRLRNQTAKRNTRTSPENQLEKDAQKPIIDIKENLAPKTDIQKNTFAGIEKIGVPYKVYPLKATYNPYIKVATAKTTYDSKQKNEFHFPENRENQTKLLAELIQNEGPVHFDYAVERLAAAWGIKQVTPKIAHAVKEALNNLITRTESSYQR